MWKICVISLAVIGIAIAHPQLSKGQKAVTPAPSKTAPVPSPSGTANPFNLTFVISARALPKLPKKNSKVDSFIKVSQRQRSSAQAVTDWTLIGQTDLIKDNDSPDFNNVFSFIWTKGNFQTWHFEVKDKKQPKDAFLGQVDVDVDDYVLKNNQDITVKLNDGGTLIIKKTTPITFRLYARNVPKMDTFNGLSDPFVECFWRKGKDGNDTLFYTTKTIDDSENPDWNETIEFANYQKGTDQYLHFKVHDKDSVSGNDFVGETLVEMDPYVAKRAAKANNRLSTVATNKATLTITPV